MSVAKSGLNLYLRTPAGDPSEKNTPDEALRRLHLRGEAGKPYQDVVRLGTDDLEVANRELDQERTNLQNDSTSGGEATAALQKIEDLLGEADQLAAQSEKTGLSQISRKSNQKQLNAIVDQINDAIKNASATNKDLFQGQTVLSAGNQTLKITRVSLADLGSIVTNGRSYSLEDIASGKSLDTARHPKRSVAIRARDTIQAALKDVKKQRDGIQKFQKEALIPRLGDVATTLEGIYNKRYTTLSATNDALKVAGEIRQAMLDSGTLAAAVGADGWDRARVLSLLDPSVAAAIDKAQSDAATAAKAAANSSSGSGT